MSNHSGYRQRRSFVQCAESFLDAKYDPKLILQRWPSNLIVCNEDPVVEVRIALARFISRLCAPGLSPYSPDLLVQSTYQLTVLSRCHSLRQTVSAPSCPKVRQISSPWRSLLGGTKPTTFRQSCRSSSPTILPLVERLLFPALRTGSTNLSPIGRLLQMIRLDPPHHLSRPRLTHRITRSALARCSSKTSRRLVSSFVPSVRMSTSSSPMLF